MTNQEAIGKMVETIANRFHPEKIILFGSHAQGAAGMDSDVDLLVVMSVKGSKREKAAEIDLALADRMLPLDLIVATPEEVEKYKNEVGTIIRSAMAEGKVIYERAA